MGPSKDRLGLPNRAQRAEYQVFRVNSYHVILDDKVMEHMVKCMKKWTPDHAPIWTCVGVTKLAFDDMKVEIEVVAYDPK